MTNVNDEKKPRKITPIKRPTQERSKNKVNKILQSAKTLLAFQGIEKLTTNHIAEHAGMSVGSIYQYFPNKQAIICEIFFEWISEVQTSIQNLREESKQVDTLTLCDKVFETVYGDDEREPEVQKLETELNKAMALYPELQEIDNEHSHAMVSLLAELIQNTMLDCDAEKVHQMAMFAFSIDTSFQYFIWLGGDRTLALEWFKKALKSILES